MNYTLEIYGNREKGAISHIMSNLRKELETVQMNPKVEMGADRRRKRSLNLRLERMIGAIYLLGRGPFLKFLTFNLP